MKSYNEMADSVLARIEEYQNVQRPRRRKRVILLLTMLVLLAALSVVTVTALSHHLPLKKKYRVYGDYFVDNTAAATIEWQNGDGEYIPLYYIRSEQIAEGITLHYYVDQNDSEYTFNSEGVMISLNPSGSSYDVLYLDESIDTEKPLDDETAIEIASAYAIAFCGEEEFEKYTPSAVEFSSIDNIYDVVFYRIYNDIIQMQPLEVRLWMDTREVQIEWDNGDELARFDEKMLDKFTKENIEGYVKKRMERCFGEGKVPDYEIASCLLMLNTNERYYLSIDVEYSSYRAHVDADKVEETEYWENIMYLVGDPMPMSNDEAIRLAKQYLVDTFGTETMERFDRIDLRYDFQYNITFYQTYRDLFVLDICFVDIAKDGSLNEVHYSQSRELDGLDLTLLDDINRSDIVAFATAVAEKKFGDRLGSVDCNGDIYVGMEEDKYVLAFTAGCGIKTDDGVEYAQALSLRYELGGVPMSDPAAIENAIVQEPQLD